MLIAAYVVVAGTLSWFLFELGRGGIPWTPAFVLSLALLWALADRALTPPSPVLREREAVGRVRVLFHYYPTVAVFLSTLAVYLSTFRWHGGDDAPNSLIPFCLLRHGTLALNPVMDPWFAGKSDFYRQFGSYFLSVFPVTPGLLALPLYIIPIAAGVVPDERFLHNLSKLSGSLITAASVAVFYRAIAKRCSKEWAFCLTALYALGSWAFSVASQALWQHGPALLGTALGLWGLEEGRKYAVAPAKAGAQSIKDLDPGLRRDDDLFWSFLSGFGFSLAFAARPDSVFFLAAAGAFVLFHERRRLLGFVAGSAAPLCFLIWYWFHYTGRLKPPESGLQSALFVGFQWQAFVALIFSPTRGLLFFFPAAVFGIWAAFRRIFTSLNAGGGQKNNPSPLVGEGRVRGGDPLSFWLLLATFGPWLLLSCYWNWVGGNTFGPRYFAVSAMVWTYFCADADFERSIRSNRRLLTAFCAMVSACILIHALGGYLTWPGSQAILAEKANVWNWGLHPVVQLFVASGSLGKLAAPVRTAVGLCLLAAFQAMEEWCRAMFQKHL